MNKEPQFDQLPEEEQDWIHALLDESIDPEAFEKLQDRMAESPDLRQIVRRSLSLHNRLSETAENEDIAMEAWSDTETPKATIPFPSEGRSKNWPIAIAACIAFLLGLGITQQDSWFSNESTQEATSLPKPDTTPAEPSAEGFAVLGNLFDVEWKTGQTEHAAGEVLGAETIQLESGVAEIQFFSGASMAVQGPAEISLRSAWGATCEEGTVRMRVPPAARGFKLNGPSTEIVDLGTEFGFSVKEGKAHVEVIDGEIEFRHRDEATRTVTKGGAWGLPPSEQASVAETGQVAFPNLSDFDQQAIQQKRFGFTRWQSYRDRLATDPRVIAYYTFEHDPTSVLIPSVSAPEDSEYHGAIVLAETTSGRWPGLKNSLEFRKPGSRVRVRIPGEFQAFTFSAWVRIDSLDRRYNALFMGDGYETGEPHWQIRDDGMLMLSVMVDDQRPNPNFAADTGFHRVYYSPPIWDRSMSGQWMHLVSVFDPEAKEVLHFVDGKRVSQQEIVDEYLIETLRIGNGEIGNWGQPFRETPWFAIRNLNGRIDELTILNAALSDSEIESLYKQSRATH